MKKNDFRELSFIHAAQREADKAEKEGMYRTASNYGTALRSLSAFVGGKDIPVSDVDEEFISKYQRWLISRDVSLNTISCYMRSLRAIYNKVTGRLLDEDKPFGNIFTGCVKTRKRSIDEDDILRLLRIPLRKGGLLQFARDIFLFSFYSLGMPFVDVAFLRCDQISDGYINYYRHKTHQRIHVPMEPVMWDIIARHHMSNSKMVFPILTSTSGLSAHCEYRSKLNQYNYALRRLQKLTGLHGKLTSYVARHTWATMAYHNQMELGLISKALGHENPHTTLIYVRELDNERLARANRKLLEHFLGR